MNLSFFHGAEKTKCPFYKDETKNSLSCEGIFGCTCIHTFATATEKKHHKEKFCDVFAFKDCILYKSIFSTYKKNQKETKGTFAEDTLLKYNQG